MIGIFNPATWTLHAVAAGLLGLLALYFFATTLFLFRARGKVPSLRMVFYTMGKSLKYFPSILAHRLRIIPARVKNRLRHSKEKIPADPEKIRKKNAGKRKKRST